MTPDTITSRAQRWNDMQCEYWYMPTIYPPVREQWARKLKAFTPQQRRVFETLQLMHTSWYNSFRTSYPMWIKRPAPFIKWSTRPSKYRIATAFTRSWIVQYNCAKVLSMPDGETLATIAIHELAHCVADQIIRICTTRNSAGHGSLWQTVLLAAAHSCSPPRCVITNMQRLPLGEWLFTPRDVYPRTLQALVACGAEPRRYEVAPNITSNAQSKENPCPLTP